MNTFELHQQNVVDYFIDIDNTLTSDQRREAALSFCILESVKGFRGWIQDLFRHDIRKTIHPDFLSTYKYNKLHKGSFFPEPFKK